MPISIACPDERIAFGKKTGAWPIYVYPELSICAWPHMWWADITSRGGPIPPIHSSFCLSHLSSGLNSAHGILFDAPMRTDLSDPSAPHAHSPAQPFPNRLTIFADSKTVRAGFLVAFPSHDHDHNHDLQLQRVPRAATRCVSPPAASGAKGMSTGAKVAVLLGASGAAGGVAAYGSTSPAPRTPDRPHTAHTRTTHTQPTHYTLDDADLSRRTMLLAVIAHHAIL